MRKGLGKEARLSYAGHALMENRMVVASENGGVPCYINRMTLMKQ